MAKTPREIRRKHGQDGPLGCSGHGERTAFDSIMHRRHSAKVPCPHPQDAAANGIADIRFKLAGLTGSTCDAPQIPEGPPSLSNFKRKAQIPRLLLRTVRCSIRTFQRLMAMAHRALDGITRNAY